MYPLAFSQRPFYGIKTGCRDKKEWVRIKTKTVQIDGVKK